MPEMKKHVVALAFPFGSHAAPLLRLVNRIATTAPQVKFSFFSTSTSNRSIFSDSTNQVNINIKPYDVADGLPEGYTTTQSPIEAIGMFLHATPGNFRRVMEVAVAETGRKISCVMSDAFFCFAGKMAEEMGVPWVPLWTAGPRSLLAHVYTELIQQRLGTNVCGDQTLDFVPGFSTLRVDDLPEGVIMLGKLETPFSKMLYNMGLTLPQATAVAINSYEEVDPDAVTELKSKFLKFLNVGPFPLTSPPQFNAADEHGCLKWLDKHQAASVAYISFGSMMTPPPQELAALADALHATGFPFLWSFKDLAKENLPNGFQERTSKNGKLVPWAPQLLVLRHRSVGVFVTHCGWNSILETIIAGVPMICRPFFGDQKLNSKIIELVWGIGVGIEGGVFTKEGVVKALELTLSSEQGKKMRGKVETLKEPAMKAVLPNGSSNENFKTLIQIVTK
ncbi:flavonoid 3-O-glucosyltransferase-like [Corylus avellana]|uniref:flavonoid 3-O-glucosyltransferase-like n=1 Tax=Corylus avellana TaxID=13451 RepID=UPI00286C6068|nr:flavonoid 3-O-glucosyltransferase-like [Corylus avellana]